LTNALRKEQGLAGIQHVYCNAHARRKFKEAADISYVLWGKAKDPEEKQRLWAEYLRIKFYLIQYRKIYRLEALAKEHVDQCLRIRKRQLKYFEKMRNHCLQHSGGYSDKSKFGTAMSYFLKNYESFIRFTGNAELPIDNNQSERLLRNPVIGRKTWYGTHSKRGAETLAILFSLVESCKLNKVNPREYLKKLVEDLHHGKNAYTPNEYRNLVKN
jgi:transposase